MTAFAGHTMMPETVEVFRERYRTPLYFEWGKSGTAFTARGVPVVYILGFTNGIVKVGQSIDFLTRLSANRSSRRVQRAPLFCGWRLGSDDMGADEGTLIRLAGELGGLPMGRTREWFTDLDVAALIAAAESELVDRQADSA